MDGTQTNPADTPGAQGDTPTEDTQQSTSLYDKTEAIVQRQEAANKKTEELLSREETLHANQRLAGTSGGHVEPTVKELTPKEYRAKVEAGIASGEYNG